MSGNLFPQNIHCFLCRGIFTYSHPDGKRYKDHLIQEHKVYFHSKWIITKTLKQQKILESKKLKNVNAVNGIIQLENGTKITIIENIAQSSGINNAVQSTKLNKIKSKTIKRKQTKPVKVQNEFNDERMETENTVQGSTMNKIKEIKNENVVQSSKIEKLKTKYPPQSSKMGKIKEVKSENDAQNSKMDKNKHKKLKRKLSKNLKIKNDEENFYPAVKIESNEVSIKYETESDDVVQMSTWENYITNESVKSELKSNNVATIILNSNNTNGEETYTCSLCPELIFPSMFEGKRHVFQHMLEKEDNPIEDDENPNNKISRDQPSVTICRSSNETKTFGCSFCPNKSFARRIYALQHVTQTKKHEYTKLEEDALNAILETKCEEEDTNKKLTLCPQCGKNFVIEEALMMHKEKCTGEFFCSECPQKYGSLPSLQNHGEMNHSDVILQCMSCMAHVFGNATLEYHQSVCHFYLGIATEEFPCTVCPRRFFSRSQLTKHLKLCGKTDALKCRHCEKSFERIVLVSEHEKECHANIAVDPLNPGEETPAFKCKLCKKVFDTIEHIIEHEKSCDNSEPGGSSEFINYEEIKKGRIRKDKSAYYVMGSFFCTDCNFSTRNFVSLKTHCSRMHPEAKLECLGCNIVLYGEATMEVHAKRCNFLQQDVANFWQCDKACERKFEKKSTLANHIRVCGSVPKDWSCPMCNKQLGEKTRLRAHIVKCKGSPAIFSCCDTDYPSFRPFLQHQKIVHEFKVDEKSQTCPICAKVMKTEKLMMMHLRNRHFSKEASETFPCPREDCGKILRQKKSLPYHLETHAKSEIISD